MRCPFCGKDQDRVVDSRSREDGTLIRRRRFCEACGRRFTTIEEIEDKILYVIKADGRREPFDRKKILKGIQIACIKRPVPVEAMEDVVEQVKLAIDAKMVREVESRIIGEFVSRHLRKLDEVAYVRFASVYRKFGDKDEFLKELKQLK